ncbi:MAG: hypothetical protein Kow0081_1240 [Candidatus Dojkabacteria bacterium]
MRKLNKYLRSFVLTASFLVVFTTFNTSRAFTLNPSSGNLADGTTIQIIADPGGFSAQAVSVHIDVAGMTVSSFTQGADGNNSLSLGDCPGGGSFTSNSVCFAYSRTSGTISPGEILGSFTVSNVTNGATVTALSESEYLNSDNETQAVTGQIGSFTVTSSGGNNNISGNNLDKLPNTAFKVASSTVLLTTGVMFISLGVLVFVYLEGKKSFK